VRKKKKRTLGNKVLSVVISYGFFKMKSLNNNFSSDLHLYKTRTPQAKMQQGHASGEPQASSDDDQR
jgi:hypothetical protein